MSDGRPHPSLRGACASAGLVLTLVTVSAATASPVLEPPTPTPPVPILDWQPCGESVEAFQCASAEVPTDYDDPTGPSTTIALTKLPATDPENRLGTLFTNPGGPGGSGVDFVHQMGHVAYAPEVRARFDILGFDPRGVGGSDPATCFRTEADETEFLADTMEFPVTDTEEHAFTSNAIHLAAHCRTTSGERFDHASTANVARDMDLLRQAVGDNQLSYVGYSYGTVLGATYAQLFPDQVRALVLDGTMSPENYTGEIDGESTSVGDRIRQGEGATETFAEFLRLCEEAGPNDCALAAVGDPKATVDALFDRLKTEPIEIEGPDGTPMTITYSTAVTATFFDLYAPAAWPVLAEFLAQLATGQPRLTATAAQALDGPPPTMEPQHGDDYPSIGSSLAPACADSGTTGRPFDYPAIADRADATAPHFGRFRAWIGLDCEFLRVNDRDAYRGPWKQEMDSPVLVIGTRFDPATPYANTRPYAANFPGARLLTLNGWGHTILGKSTCADQAVADYLVTLIAPAEATCEPDVRPFDPTVAKRDIPQRPAGVPALTLW